jgi:hypothetical protein
MVRKPAKPKRQIEPASKPVLKFNTRDHFCVLVDCNEGYPVTFPPALRMRPKGARRSALVTLGREVLNLGRVEESYGDYTMKGYAYVSGTERKKSIAEIQFNLKNGRLDQQLSALHNLVEYPYLLLDFPLPEMYGTGHNAAYREDDPTPAVLDIVLEMLNDYKVQVLGPYSGNGVYTRRLMGEWMVRRMLSHVYGRKYVTFRKLRTSRGQRNYG